MKSIFILVSILLITFAGTPTAWSQTYAREYPSVAALPLVAPGIAAPLKSIFSSREQWELAYGTSLTDITVDGVVDTAYGNDVYYVGGIIPTFQMADFQLGYVGRDSATIVARDRKSVV